MDTKDLAAKGLKLRKEMVGAANVEQRIQLARRVRRAAAPMPTAISGAGPACPMGVKSLAMIAMMAAASASTSRAR